MSEEMKSTCTVLYIEPFYGGSHKQLMDLLMEEFPGDLYTLPATKWHWRMRTSALHFSLTLPLKHNYRILFASSVLNLCELVSLRPDLRQVHKVLYFHENQLTYPVRKQQDRDFQYGYNELLSCLVADKILFNSHFNMSSFLSSIDSHLKLLPDHTPRGLADVICPKCSVLHFPLKVDFPLPSSSQGIALAKLDDSEPSLVTGDTKQDLSTPNIQLTTSEAIAEEMPVDTNKTLYIVWPHRWEHDKGPEVFCSVITKLLDAQLNFKLSVLGAHTNDIPECFSRLFPCLGSRLLHSGSVTRSDYWEILKTADVVVSTSKHEFFGVAMMEAVSCGCYPLCPNRLVYPELYPEGCLYNTEQQLFKKLKRFCQRPHLARLAEVQKQMKLDRYLWSSLKKDYCYHLNNPQSNNAS